MIATTVHDEQLDRLANFEPSPFPVVSLYLNAQADQNGKTTFDAFVRKELRARAQTYTPRSEERESFDRDIGRIEEFLRTQLDPSSKGVAVFACSGENLFETMQLEAPLDDNELFVQSQPHLYTLARLHDQYRRYAVLIADTDEAHILVFGLRAKLDESKVESDKLRRTQAGGWSQARFQRHVDNFREQHVKEVIEALDRIVAEDNIADIIFSGDEVVIPLIRDNLPKHLAGKVVDVLRLDVRTPEHEVLEQTLETMRRHDSETDAEKVKRLLDEFRSGGLGVCGVRQTLAALRNGQVDELLITAQPQRITLDHEKPVRDILENEFGIPVEPAEDWEVVLSSALVTRARQTGAKICFLEDPALLENVGGVGALLRYRHAGVIQ
jgi:peptide chain release factor subunit 1